MSTLQHKLTYDSLSPWKFGYWRFRNFPKYFISVLGLAFLAAVITASSATNLYATTWNVSVGSPGACTIVDPNCATISAAVAAASSGDTINVATGAYAETVTITKPLTLNGAQSGVDARGRAASESSVSSTGVEGTFVIGPAAGTVTIDGFDLSGTPTPGSGGVIYVSGLTTNVVVRNNIIEPSSADGILLYNAAAGTAEQNWVKGAAIGGISGGKDAILKSVLTIQNNRIDGALYGITGYLDLSAISNNEITGTGSGAAGIGGQFYNTTIAGNQVSGYTAGVALAFQDYLSRGMNTINVANNTFTGNAAGVYVNHNIAGLGITVNNNSIAGNPTGGVVYGPSGAGTLDASANWWGTNVAATVKTAANGGLLVDYTPWLNSGTDTAPGTVGFQGDFSVLNVDDDSPQTGVTGRVQEGVNLVIGSTISVAAGTYDEQVVIDGKNLVLQGAGDTTIIRPSGPATLTSLYTYPAGTFWPGTVMSGVILVKNSDATTVKNLKVDGVNVTSLPAGAARVAGILYGESAGVIENATVTTMVVNGYSTRSYGIDLSAVGTARGVEVKICHISNWSRNGIQAQGASLTANIHDNTLTGPGDVHVGAAVPNGILFIHGPGGNATGNTISALHHSVSSSRSAGVLFYDPLTVGIVVENNDISDTDDGVNVAHNANGVIIRNNNLHNNLEVGIHLEDGGTGTTITSNFITGNTTAGIRFAGAGDPIPANADDPPGTGNVAHSNSITGNGLGVVNYDTVGLQVFDASGNWWGSNVAATVVAQANGGVQVDHSPWLNSGTDIAPGTPGFQPDLSMLVVGPGSTADIQEAIDLALPGGTVIVSAGTYTGNLDVNKAITLKGTFTITGTLTVSAAGAVLSPGLSPGIINSGDLSLISGSTVNIEINGTTVGTQYDQLNVTGTVNLGNATLNVTTGFTPVAGNSFVIVNNDGSDAVTGTFSGLAQGSIFSVNGITFQISYTGGSGNDVVLTVVTVTCDTLTIPTGITTLTGQPVTVPVNTTDLTVHGVLSADFTITYDPAVLTPIANPTFGVALGSVGTSNGGGRVLTVSNPSAGTLIISILGANFMTGAGVLVNLNFNTIGLPPTSSAINFTAFQYNDGTPCSSTTNGSVTVDFGTITGTVSYGNAIGSPAPPRHVPGVLISGAGTPAVSATTIADGTYSLSGFGPGAYTVTPTKTGGVFSGLSALDSAMIAQHVVGIITLNATQQTVADVSGNGGINSFDAALIARYVAALSGSGSSGTWKFVPVSRAYANVNTNQTGQDYDALLMGDVTGNWFDPGATLRQATFARTGKPVSVTLPNVSASRGSEVVVPVNISDSTDKGILSYEFDLAYDPAVLEPQQNPTDASQTLSDGRVVTVNPRTPGLLKVVVFGALPISGEGALLNLRFNAIGDVGSTSALTWQDFKINEGNVYFLATGGQVEITAANANESAIEGRLLTAMGQGVANTRITLTDTTGASRSMVSNGFGYFRFAGVQVGQTYTLSAASKRYTFTPLTVSVTGELVNLDLVAEP